MRGMEETNRRCNNISELNTCAVGFWCRREDDGFRWKGMDNLDTLPDGDPLNRILYVCLFLLQRFLTHSDMGGAPAWAGLGNSDGMSGLSNSTGMSL